MLPLDGITVVSLEQAVAAPFCTRQLADLGARVIKIERPGVGDFARGYDESVLGQSSYFVWLNRSKESIALDLKDPRGREVVERLLPRADVFVQNLAPGAAERLGFGPATLAARHPSLIRCDISGYGSSGPWASRKAYDLLVQCETGLVAITGTPSEMARVGISVADIAAGMYAFSGVLAALYQRAITGIAPAVEVSLFEALAEWMGAPLNYTRYGGQQPVRMGARHATIAPYGAFEAGDGGTILVCVQNEREWSAFCTTFLAAPSVAVDERFARNSARVANRPALESLIAARFASLNTQSALDLLDQAGVANARINSIDDFVHHPVLTARNRWRPVTTPGGPVDALLPPTTLAGVEPRMAPVPAVGEHTAPILRELGYTEPEIAALRR